MIGKIGSWARTRRQREEHLYEIAALEIERGEQRKGLWLKALSETNYDIPKAKANYLRLRVQSLSDELLHAAKTTAAPDARQPHREEPIFNRQSETSNEVSYEKRDPDLANPVRGARWLKATGWIAGSLVVALVSIILLIEKNLVPFVPITLLTILGYGIYRSVSVFRRPSHARLASGNSSHHVESRQQARSAQAIWRAGPWILGSIFAFQSIDYILLGSPPGFSILSFLWRLNWALGDLTHAPVLAALQLLPVLVSGYCLYRAWRSLRQ